VQNIPPPDNNDSKPDNDWPGGGQGEGTGYLILDFEVSEMNIKPTFVPTYDARI
jgi:hypothetical protein